MIERVDLPKFASAFTITIWVSPALGGRTAKRSIASAASSACTTEVRPGQFNHAGLCLAKPCWIVDHARTIARNEHCNFVPQAAIFHSKCASAARVSALRAVSSRGTGSASLLPDRSARCTPQVTCAPFRKTSTFQIIDLNQHHQLSGPNPLCYNPKTRYRSP